jgi:hypothetical protein
MFWVGVSVHESEYLGYMIKSFGWAMAAYWSTYCLMQLMTLSCSRRASEYKDLSTLYLHLFIFEFSAWTHSPNKQIERTIHKIEPTEHHKSSGEWQFCSCVFALCVSDVGGVIPCCCGEIPGATFQRWPRWMFSGCWDPALMFLFVPCFLSYPAFESWFCSFVADLISV